MFLDGVENPEYQRKPTQMQATPHRKTQTRNGDVRFTWKSSGSEFKGPLAHLTSIVIQSWQISANGEKASLTLQFKVMN